MTFHMFVFVLYYIAAYVQWYWNTRSPKRCNHAGSQAPKPPPEAEKLDADLKEITLLG